MRNKRQLPEAIAAKSMTRRVGSWVSDRLPNGLVAASDHILLPRLVSSLDSP
jgi:hypothetical protein